MAERRRSQKESKRAPCILIVDDKIEDANAKKLLFSQSATPIPRTPDEVTLKDLAGADLALVDLVLDEWGSIVRRYANTLETVSLWWPCCAPIA
jgi:hypothetical protein